MNISFEISVYCFICHCIVCYLIKSFGPQYIHWYLNISDAISTFNVISIYHCYPDVSAVVSSCLVISCCPVRSHYLLLSHWTICYLRICLCYLITSFVVSLPPFAISLHPLSQSILCVAWCVSFFLFCLRAMNIGLMVCRLHDVLCYLSHRHLNILFQCCLIVSFVISFQLRHLIISCLSRYVLCYLII